MTDFRKQMHVAFKERLHGIISTYCVDMFANMDKFEQDPILFIENWINSNCLPMGDFDKEQAIKEIQEWSK